MSAYSSQHWPENGHGYFEADPYRSEGSRGTNRAFYRQQEPRWFHGEGSPHAPYGGGSSREFGRHSEVTDWGHYPGPPPLENGYREREEYPLQHRGDPPMHARNSPRPNPYDDPRLRRDVHSSSWNRGSPRAPVPFHHSPTIDTGRSDLSPHAVHDSHPSPHPPPPLHRALPPYGDLSKLHRFREGGGGNFGKRPPLESSRSYPPSSSGQYNGGAYWGEGSEGQYPPQRRNSPHKVLLPTPCASQEDRLPESHHGYQRVSASSMSPCSNSPDVDSPRYSRTGALEVHDQQRVPVHAPLQHRDRGQLEPRGPEREIPCSGGLPIKREGLPSYSMRAEEKRTVPYSHGVKDSDRRYGQPHLSLEGGYPLERDRTDGLVPHHQSASLESLGSRRTDNMRDPRLQRNKNIAQPATSPSAAQVLKEHSYCLDRVSYESQPNLQQKQSGSCYLTRIPKPGSQKTKPATQKVVATPSEKPQASSVALSRNQSEQQSKTEPVPADHAKDSTPAQESSPAKEVQIKKEPEADEITMPPEQLDIAKRPDCEENQTAASDSKHLDASEFRVQQLSSRSTVESLEEGDEFYPPSPKFSMEGFHLDLDTEPDSSGEEEGGLGPDSFMIHVPNNILPNHWSIATPDELRPRVSRMDHSEANSEPLKLSLKKYQANQFQLRNGRVLPARTLAFYASQKSPLPQSSSPPTSGRSSPEIHHRRRSQRLAALATAGEEEESNILASLSDAEDDNSESGGEDGSWNKHEPPDSDESYHLPYTVNVAEDCSRPPTDVGFGKVSIAGRDKDEVEDPAQQASVGKRKRPRRGRKSRFFMYGKNKKKRPAPQAREDSIDTQASNIELEHSPSMLPNYRRNYQDFRPVILETRSRGESVTLMRRKVMEEEIKQHELERVQTARQGHEEYIEYVDMQGEEMDDNGSVYSATSSSLASRDVDSTTTKSSILEQFPPELVARCKKITTAKSSGDTPLHKVCRTGKYDMARYLLLVETVSVNAQDHAGWTSLHEACSSCNLRIAELLLQCGADANLSATDGTRPIHDAIETGSLDLVKLLIQYGADPLAEFGEKTPVEFARAQGQSEIFRYLKELVKERQTSRPIPPSSPVREKSTPTRQSRKQKLTRQAEDVTVMFPVDGYSSEDPSFGAELDYPLFYVAPVVEMSEDPHLPVYNLAVAPGSSSRRHNFYLLDELLDNYDYSESEIEDHCSGVRMLELTVAEFHRQMQVPYSYFNQMVCISERIRTLPKNAKIKFVPLCNQLRILLGIEVVNLDD